MKKTVIVIAYILAVLVLVVAVGLIFRFTSGGNSTFCVEVGGQTFSTDGEYALSEGQTRFETKYAFSSNEEDKHKGYNLKVAPNVENDFWFTAGGADEKLSSIDDYSAAFSIESDVTGFTVSYDGSSVEEILGRMYEGKEIILDEGMDFSKAYFNLVVSSSDNVSVVTIGLKLNIGVSSITLDKEDIVF